MLKRNCYALLTLPTLVLLLISSQPAFALSIEESRHLLSRTGFAPSFSEIKTLSSLNRRQAIDYQLSTLKTEPFTELPDKFRLPYQNDFNWKKASQQQKKQQRKLLRQQSNELKQWWLHEMIVTHSPFTENLTLFWHNHFVSSSQKVKHPALMAQQNATLRQHAANNFADFVKIMLKDPALLRYLDNHKNRKDKPNENLARELLELFTLGEGHYSEQDVKQAAKALSGYTVNPKTGQFRFNRKQHDHSSKTLFGERGDFDANDLVDLILKQPQTARHITQKLWQHYITTPVPPQTLSRLSDRFRQDYQLKPLIRAILMQPEFWHADNIGSKIKDPINLVVGTLRQFKQQPKQIKQLLRAASSMGQNLLAPPNVKGWNTGTAWINTTTLLARQNYMAKATRGMQLKALVQQQNQSNQAWLKALLPSSQHAQIDSQQQTWQVVKQALNHISYQLE